MKLDDVLHFKKHAKNFYDTFSSNKLDVINSSIISSGLFNDIVLSRKDLEPVFPLLTHNFLSSKTTSILQIKALNCQYYDAVFTVKNIEELYSFDEKLKENVPLNTYIGEIFSWDKRFSVLPYSYITHPTTFMRLTNLWKYSEYFHTQQLAAWKGWGDFSDSNAENYVWGQWLLFNKITFKEL
jgi:hypothetical protein